MGYVRNTWKDNIDPTFDPLTDPPISAENLNNIEQGIVDAHSHVAATDNPHSVTKDQVGLGNVTNDAQLKASQLETAITDNDSKVPSSGAVVDYVAAQQSSGDMLKSTYDTDADGKVNAAVAADSVPWSGVSSKPATFPPESHTHGNISNAGAIGSTANLPLITGTSGIVQAGSFGSGANTFCQGNDARLSDARTPSAHTHGNITNAGAIGSTSGVPIITGSSGVLQAGSFGTGSGTFCQGNDSRLSDARTPVSHAHGNITNGGLIGTTANIPIITGTGGILQAGSFGTGANTFCAGDDSRLVTNAKQADRPFAFQTGHTAWATGLSNEEIGRIQLQTGETLYIRRVELQIKGGGTSSSLSVNAYDSTNTTTIASQTAGGVNTTGGNSGAAALVLIRLTNSVGSTQNASVYISGWIRS